VGPLVADPELDQEHEVELTAVAVHGVEAVGVVAAS
jgi:hypothetical protein